MSWNRISWVSVSAGFNGTTETTATVWATTSACNASGSWGWTVSGTVSSSHGGGFGVSGISSTAGGSFGMGSGNVVTVNRTTSDYTVTVYLNTTNALGGGGTEYHSSSSSVTVPKRSNWVYTYDGNGGTPTKYTDTHYYGYGTELPEAVRDNYTLTGWLDNNGNSYSSGESVDIRATTTFTAQWRQNYLSGNIYINDLYRCDNTGARQRDGTYAFLSFGYTLGTMSGVPLESNITVSVKNVTQSGSFMQIARTKRSANGTYSILIGSETLQFSTNNQYQIWINIADTSLYGSFSAYGDIFTYNGSRCFIDARADWNIVSPRREAPDDCGEQLLNTGIEGLILWDSNEFDSSDIWFYIEEESEEDQTFVEVCEDLDILTHVLDGAPLLTNSCILDVQKDGELLSMGRTMDTYSYKTGMIIAGPRKQDGDIWFDLDMDFQEDYELNQVLEDLDILDDVTLSETIWVVTAQSTHGTFSGTGSYAQGDRVVLFFSPEEGYEVDKWYEGETVVQTGGTVFEIDDIQRNYTLSVSVKDVSNLVEEKLTKTLETTMRGGLRT